MNVGCFALLQPFSSLSTQFQQIRKLGLTTADITDNHDGGSLGVEYGFAASVSLDSHPQKIRQLADEQGVRLSAFCAHANLLDPPSPDIYSTNQIIKAIRLAPLLGISHVITTDGDPKTDFGHALTPEQRRFAICERLYEPIRWAKELGVRLLLETHGPVTDSVDEMGGLLEELGHEENVGLCLDTGNSWLGGADPIEFIKRFGQRIHHVHWKDMGAEWGPRRGSVFGCGMGTIPLGAGVIGIEEIVRALLDIGFRGETTLEVAGPENVRASLAMLKGCLQAAHPA
jgi:inosose dehydratase